MALRVIPLVLSKYQAEKGIMTFLTDYGKSILRPYVLWFIEGCEENIIVDTAIEAVDYKNYHPKFRDLEMESVMTFEQALESVNLTPDKVDIVIQTHLHFDHCHNTMKCRNARVLVQQQELEFMENPAPFEGLYRRNLLANLNIEPIRGDFHLCAGIDLLSVPGHTAGGQAVCIDTEKGKVVISGLCSITENYHPASVSPMAGDDDLILPGIMVDAVKTHASMLRIKNVADVILPLHDPEIISIKSIP